MKVIKFDTSRLRNEEHFQFLTELRDSVIQYVAETLQISDAFAVFLVIYLQEQEALHVIRKSATTEDLANADTDRDVIFRGLVDAIKSAHNHFNSDKQAAANRLIIVLNQYGNLARKPYDQETAGINKLVLESKNAYAADVEILSISDWFNELNTRNLAFDALMKSRYSEEALKTILRMKQVRIEIDAAYKAIVTRLDALMLINGESTYEAFVRELNSRVTKYTNIIAQRKGHAAKGDTDANKPAK